MILGAVTIRERVERVRIEDPFVVHQFVVFGTGSGAELILFGIPVHAVGLDDGGDTWLGLRRPEFIQGVLLEDLIVELGCPSALREKPRTLHSVLPRAVM